MSNAKDRLKRLLDGDLEASDIAWVIICLPNKTEIISADIKAVVI